MEEKQPRQAHNLETPAHFRPLLLTPLVLGRRRGTCSPAAAVRSGAGARHVAGKGAPREDRGSPPGRHPNFHCGVVQRKNAWLLTRMSRVRSTPPQQLRSPMVGRWSSKPAHVGPIPTGRSTSPRLVDWVSACEVGNGGSNPPGEATRVSSNGRAAVLQTADGSSILSTRTFWSRMHLVKQRRCLRREASPILVVTAIHRRPVVGQSAL